MSKRKRNISNGVIAIVSFLTGLGGGQIDFSNDISPNTGVSFPAIKYIEKSVYAVEIPNTSPDLIISKEKCKSWADCGIYDKPYSSIKILEGDYRDWGKLSITQSGTAQKPRIIRGEGKVNIATFEIVFADYVILDNLHFSEGVNSRIAADANHNVINNCIIEKPKQGSALTINHSHHNTVQNSVIRCVLGSDYVGILINSGSATATNNHIVSNEIIDCNDGIQLIWHTFFPESANVNGTIIDNNDIYITEKSYSPTMQNKACTENGIDIKIGGKSTNQSDLIRITNNRLHGFRKSDTSCGASGSNGDAIIIHQVADNILIEGNIIEDCPRGIGISHNTSRHLNIRIENNLFAEISEVGITSAVNFRANYNTFTEVKTPIHRQSRARAWVMCNTINQADKYQYWQPANGTNALNAVYNSAGYISGNNLSDSLELSDMVYQRKENGLIRYKRINNVFAKNRIQINKLFTNKLKCH